MVFVPLLNLRLVCVDHTPSGGRRAAVSSATCDELCPRDAAPARGDETPDTGCMLVAGGCSAGTSVVIVLPPAPVQDLPRPTAVAVEPVALSPYHPPSVSPVSPPPKA